MRPGPCQRAVKKRALGRPATDEWTALRFPSCRSQTNEMQSHLQDSRGDGAGTQSTLFLVTYIADTCVLMLV